MTDLNLMGTNIKTILGAVPGILESFDHEPQSMNQLPAATLYWDGFSQNDQASRRKSVNWVWIIRIYVPIRTSNVKKPQDDIRNFVKNAIKQLRADPSLGSSCLYHKVNNGDVFALLDQNNPLLVAELTLEATTNEDF